MCQDKLQQWLKHWRTNQQTQKPDLNTSNFKVEPACQHNQQKVPVGDFSILCSEYLHKAERVNPDLGIYMSSVWDARLGLISGAGVSIPPEFGGFPNLQLDWSDGKDFDLLAIDWLCVLVSEQLSLGKRVEIGCMGGHGRTGTLLSCIIGFVENLDAKDAINAARIRYCKKVVETQTQIKMIGSYLGGSVKGIEPTNLPVVYNYANAQIWKDGKWQSFNDNAPYGYWE